MIELLAPAGNEECFFAAINNGADAVYLGLDSFSARKNAGNFTKDNINYFVSYAHTTGVKVYVALNTIVKDEELKDFLLTASYACSAGADALIVQDVFLGKLLREYFPDIELHLSTQAGINNAEGVAVAKEYGFSRVILARETERKEIKSIAEKIDTEIFVHGALCSSFSGHCYMSSFIGGNSGNRGLCKQPCRKKYKIETKSGGGEYSFSLADLKLDDKISEIEKLGVKSVKIEGRMRTPEYVAAAVRLYRNAIDGKTADGEEIFRTYNRGDYTKGYVYGYDGGIVSDKIQNHKGAFYGKVKKIGSDKLIADSSEVPHKGDGFKIVRDGFEVGNAVALNDGRELAFKGSVKVGDEIRITRDEKLSEKLDAVPGKKEKLVVSAKFSEGEFPELSAKCVTVVGEEVLEKAKTRPVAAEDIGENLLKTDVYPFEPQAEVFVKGEPFIVKSRLNALRAKFYETVFYKDVKPLEKVDFIFDFANNFKPSYKGVAMAERYVSLPEGYAFVLFPDSYDDRKKIETETKLIREDKYLYVPAFLREDDVKIIEELLPLFDGVYADGLSGLEIADKASKKVIVGTGFNVFNSADFSELKKRGINDIVFSKELSLREAEKISGSGYMFTFGRIRLAEFLYCPFKKQCFDCRRKNYFSVTDDTGHSFMLRRYKLNGKCRFELYNGDIIKTSKTAYNFFNFIKFSDRQTEAFLSGREDGLKDLKFTVGNLKRGIL